MLAEKPVLGHMKELETAIGQIAGLGLRIHSILQDLGQLKAIYKDRYETVPLRRIAVNGDFKE